MSTQRGKIMQLRVSKRSVAIFVLAVSGGLAITLFILIGPPKLLAKSESPDFCASCHVMEEEFTAWQHSGAHRRLKCVDCHLPNSNPVSHYMWKSIDGMKDVVIFTSLPRSRKNTRHGVWPVSTAMTTRICRSKTLEILHSARLSGQLAPTSRS